MREIEPGEMVRISRSGVESIKIRAGEAASVLHFRARLFFAAG